MSEIQFSPKIELISENTILIRFSEKISATLPEKIARCRKAILHQFNDLITDTIPSYNSLLIYYNFRRYDPHTLAQQIHETVRLELLQGPLSLIENPPIVIPVYYHPEVGWDLEQLALTNELSVDDVIHLHCSVPYLVCAIGFAPGFAYMGFVDPRIASPRLNTPRHHVPKGSVGIANQQTGIYPKNSPGGWNIIGRTPISMFSLDTPLESSTSKKNNAKPCPIEVGDKITFQAINREEFIELGGEIDELNHHR